MKGIISTKYGQANVLQLREVEKPFPKENEVLINVKAANVSRADTMMRTGKPYIGRLFMGFSKPKNAIPGTGFAGIIESIGSSVKLFKIGDRVFGESIASFGAHAEYICIAEGSIISQMPKNMTFDEAAPVSDGALTTMNFLKNLGEIKPGQKVLINGASGGLGTAAIQLAKYFGAEVTGVCSNSNLELVKSLGADHTIDYENKDFTKTEQSYDIIYDTVGKSSFSACKSVLTQNGVYISPVLGMPLLGDVIYTSMFGKKKAKFSATGALPIKELKILFQELIEIIKKDKIKTIVDRSFQLENIVEAHNYIDEGHKKGNVIVSN